MSGSHAVLDERRSRKQAARFQDLLQRSSHAYLPGGENVRSGHEEATTGRRSKLLPMASSLSRLVSDADRRLILRRLFVSVVGCEFGTATHPETIRCLSLYMWRKRLICALPCPGGVRLESRARPTFAGRSAAESVTVLIRQTHVTGG